MQESQRYGSDRPPARRQNGHGNTRRSGSASGRRPSNSRQRPPRQIQNGYTLQKHPINFGGRRGRLRKLDPLTIVVFGVALILLIVLVFSLVSCIGSCSSSDTAKEPVVEEGLSTDLSNSLKARLTQDDQLTQIAANASQYPEALIQLALDEPSAVSFVYAYPTANKDTAGTWSGSVTKGVSPTLYTFNSAWGYLTYADQPLALTGSGPVVMSMAYMGLTGSTDKTPADLATLATDGGYATGDASTSADFFTSTATSLGLTAAALDSQDGTTAADALGSALSAGSVVAVEVSGSTFGTDRWILVTTLNSDGSVTIHDPLSTSNTAHPWDPATILALSKSGVVISDPNATSTSSDTDKSSDSSTTSDTSTDSSTDTDSTSE
jgi:hypothetical protein